MWEPIKLVVEGKRWVALRVQSQHEFAAAQALTERGLTGYCPVGVKAVMWESHHKRAPRGSIKQFPVFSRYIFCGLRPGETVGRDNRIGIEAVLGADRRDQNGYSLGPLYVPPAAIKAINDNELAGVWDSAKSWKTKSRFAVGQAIRILEGPFTGFAGVVGALESEIRIRILIDIFGRQTTIRIDPCQIAAEAA